MYQDESGEFVDVVEAPGGVEGRVDQSDDDVDDESLEERPEDGELDRDELADRAESPQLVLQGVVEQHQTVHGPLPQR